MNDIAFGTTETNAFESECAAKDIEKAKRKIMARLTSDENPDYLWEVLENASRFVDAFDSEGEPEFASWLLHLTRDPLHFVPQLSLWITDGLAFADREGESLTNRQHAERFLVEKDRILLALYRPS
jgi:hypothetical protein